MDSMHWIKNQRAEAIHFLRQFFNTDEATAVESYHVYVPLIIDNVRISTQGVKAILDSEGASNMPLDQVADVTLVDEVLQQRKSAR
jgi:hypothetical protein